MYAVEGGNCGLYRVSFEVVSESKICCIKLLLCVN